MQHTGTAVMTGRHEAIETERRHDLDLILSHGAKRITRVVVAARRLFGIAVAAQVGTYDGEFFGELRREFVPARMGERIAVHQKDRRTAAAVYRDYAGAAGLDLATGEILEHVPLLFPLRLRGGCKGHIFGEARSGWGFP